MRWVPNIWEMCEKDGLEWPVWIGEFKGTVIVIMIKGTPLHTEVQTNLLNKLFSKNYI